MRKFIGISFIVAGLAVTLVLSVFTQVKGAPAGIIGAMVSAIGIVILG